MLTIEQVSWAEHWHELTDLRRRVFVEEQKVPVELELDEHDFSARHWRALLNGEVVGTVRLLDDGHVGRMAVAAEHRGSGVGRQLLDTVIQEALALGLEKLQLAAQQHAIAFYERAGFKAFGELFLDAGIVHRNMARVLRADERLGDGGGKFAVSSLADSALSLVSRSRRQVWILCRCLEPEIYAQPRMVELLSNLARRHRDSEVRLLISDERPLRESRHALVELSQRLSSSIHIRVLGDEQSRELSEYFLLGDNEAIIVQQMHRDGSAWGGFNLRPTVRAYRDQFDRLWQHARPSPWLRRLP